LVKMSSGVADAYMHGSMLRQSNVSKLSLPAQVHWHSSFEGGGEKWERRKKEMKER